MHYNTKQTNKEAELNPIQINDALPDDDLMHVFWLSTKYFQKVMDGKKHPKIDTDYWNGTGSNPVFFRYKKQVIPTSHTRSLLLSKDGEFNINGKNGYILDYKRTNHFYRVDYKGLHGYIAMTNQWA